MADNDLSSSSVTGDHLGLKPGEIFWNHYRVLSIIGKGGVSTVYKGENIQSKQHVAIKVLHAHKTHDEELVRRFIRECQLTTKLEHPHAIHIFEWGIDDHERPFMIMEYLSGETLSKRIQERSGLNHNKAVEIMEQICAAVGEAHSLGIIHRDLKPDNIMLTTHSGMEDFVKVVDFGIAKLEAADEEGAVAMANLTKTGAIMGTPLYMSPEQLRGRKADARSDIYALGVIMYEMLTGKPPFDSKNTAEIVVGHLNVTPDSPPKVRMDLNIPEELSQAVMRALAKNPWERPTTVQEFLKSIVKAVEKPDAVLPGAIQSMPAQAIATSSVRSTPETGIKYDPVRKICPQCKTVSSGVNYRYCLKCGQDNINRWLPYVSRDEPGRGVPFSSPQSRWMALLAVLGALLAWSVNIYLSVPVELTGKFVGSFDHELYSRTKTLRQDVVKRIRFSRLTLLVSQQDDVVTGLVNSRFGQSSLHGTVQRLSPVLISYDLDSKVYSPDGSFDIEMNGVYDKILRKQDWIVKVFFKSAKYKPVTESARMTLTEILDEGKKDKRSKVR